jgi:organic hydroperoxide reductase OsmC/OhrA
MSSHLATIRWSRGSQTFTDSRYSRGHVWAFDGGIEVPASSSPHVVPVPYANANAVDPEEALVASVSSCHMLFFLFIAMGRKFCVDSYVDDAVGVMGKNASGKSAVTLITLRPKADFSGARLPTRDDIDSMHHEAHDECFIANSLKTEIRCEPVYG